MIYLGLGAEKRRSLIFFSIASLAGSSELDESSDIFIADSERSLSGSFSTDNMPDILSYIFI